MYTQIWWTDQQKQKTQKTTIIINKKKWVLNMCSRQLTHIETNLLVMDVNFSIISKTLPNNDIVTTIEDAVKDLEKMVPK